MNPGCEGTLNISTRDIEHFYTGHIKFYIKPYT